MDNTELHYLTYDPEEIWNRMMLNYVEAGGGVLYPGDEKEMLLRSVQADIVQVFAGIDNALRMQTLRYAVGDYLDALGELRGCERMAAAAATATVSITTNATGSSGTLAAGTAMTRDGQIFYMLENDIALSGNQETLYATVAADREGTAGNGLLCGSEMELSVKNPAINSIVVTEAASGGRNKEDDDTYRERIRLHGLASVTTGPASQYKAVAMEASPYVLDAAALNGGAGRVNLYLIVEDGVATQSVVSAVSKAVSDDVVPLTDNVYISLAADIPYVLNVEYAVEDDYAALSSELSEAVSEYQEWQDYKIGRAFNPEKLRALMYQAGCDRVEFAGDSSFNTSGDIEYTAISGSSRCKGTITLTKVT